MSTRHTPALREIVDALFTEVDEESRALVRLDRHFRDRLLVDAGNAVTVGTCAEETKSLFRNEAKVAGVNKPSA